MWPTNEAETIELYKLVQGWLGWRIVHLQTAFPDAIIENRNGAQLVAEFEYRASNFRNHRHDPAGCDLIICWRHDWSSAHLPVWALEDCAIEEVALINALLETRALALQEALRKVSYLKSKAGHLEDKAAKQFLEIGDLQTEILTLRGERGHLHGRIRQLTEQGAHFWSDVWLGSLPYKLGWYSGYGRHACEYCGGCFMHPAFVEHRYCSRFCEQMADFD